MVDSDLKTAGWVVADVGALAYAVQGITGTDLVTELGLSGATAEIAFLLIGGMAVLSLLWTLGDS